MSELHRYTYKEARPRHYAALPSMAPRALAIGVGFARWYTRHVHRLSSHDDDVYRRFARVMHLLRPPSHLFHPSVLGKVLLGALSGRGSEPGTRTPEPPAPPSA